MEVAGLAGAGQVGTAAELDGIVGAGLADGILADEDHTDRIGIFFAEHGAHAGNLLRLLQGHGGHRHRAVGADLLVDQILDAADFRRGEGLVVREVEAGLLVIDQRTLLVHLVAQHLAHGPVHQVGDGVVAHDGQAALAVGLEERILADLDQTGFDAAHMEHGIAQALGVLDPEASGGGGGPTAVAHLSALLGVETGAVGDDGAGVAGLQGALALDLVVGHIAQHLARGAETVVLQRVIARGDLPLQRGDDQLLAALARGVAELLHLLVVAGQVDGEAFFLGHLAGDVDEEAVGGVQVEHLVAAQHLATGLAGLLGDLGEQAHAAVEGAEEGLLLIDQHALDLGLALAHLGEGVAHGFRHRGNQLVQERLAGAQVLAAVAFGAAQDAAHHIAALLVAGGGAIGQGEGQGADVVGHHAVGGVAHVIEPAGVGGGLGEILDGREQAAEQVDVVVAPLALQHGADALETHAGVDMLGRECAQASIGVTVELNENIVPDLDAAVGPLIHQSCARFVGSEVDMDLGAGAAGAGVTHLPEVVLLVAQVDVLPGDVGGLGPDFGGLGVCPQLVLGVPLEHGGVQAGGVESPHLGEELPGPTDGFLLEVVAEGPVAQHLEEGVVVGVLADIVEVVVLAAGADALLRVDGAAVGARAGAQEHILELVHAGVGEQQRGVFQRYHGAGGHKGVPVLAGEEVDELLTDLAG